IVNALIGPPRPKYLAARTSRRRPAIRLSPVRTEKITVLRANERGGWLRPRRLSSVAAAPDIWGSPMGAGASSRARAPRRPAGVAGRTAPRASPGGPSVVTGRICYGAGRAPGPHGFATAGPLDSSVAHGEHSLAEE